MTIITTTTTANKNTTYLYTSKEIGLKRSIYIYATTTGFIPVDREAEEAGLLLGVLFTVLLCVLLLGLGGFLYIKHRRARNLENENSLKLRAKQNAGVYQETTASENVLFSIPHKRKQGEYSSVSKNDYHYESDSSDEI